MGQDAPVGDLERDTEVRRQADGTYEATVNGDWEIWGPMGGYIAAIALRAAGAEADGRVPVAFSCHYLGVARFEPVQIRVETRMGGRRATSQRVELAQDGRPVLDAMVWSVLPSAGLEHDEVEPLDLPDPEGLPSIQELLPDDAPSPPFPFWDNFESRPLDFSPEWPPPGPLPARWRGWLRFVPTPTFADPWVDGARTVILADLPSWPAASRPHAHSFPPPPEPMPWVAPTLDLNVAFQRPTSGHEWLLCEGTAPLSTGGLFGWTARVWSPGGKLHATGGGQCLYRKMRPPT